jgi:hypothetical protein
LAVIVLTAVSFQVVMTAGLAAGASCAADTGEAATKERHSSSARARRVVRGAEDGMDEA